MYGCLIKLYSKAKEEDEKKDSSLKFLYVKNRQHLKCF